MSLSAFFSRFPKIEKLKRPQEKLFVLVFPHFANELLYKGLDKDFNLVTNSKTQMHFDTYSKLIETRYRSQGYKIVFAVMMESFRNNGNDEWRERKRALLNEDEDLVFPLHYLDPYDDKPGVLNIYDVERLSRDIPNLLNYNKIVVSGYHCFDCVFTAVKGLSKLNPNAEYSVDVDLTDNAYERLMPIETDGVYTVNPNINFESYEVSYFKDDLLKDIAGRLWSYGRDYKKLKDKDIGISGGNAMLSDMCLYGLSNKEIKNLKEGFIHSKTLCEI